MKSVVTVTGAYKRHVEVEVPPDEVRPFMEKAVLSYQKKVHINGFRKGKVPLSILQRRFGEAIKADVADDLIQRFFQQAIKENGLKVVSPGTAKDVFFEEDKPFRFAAEVEVEPEVKVANYKGLKVEKEILKVTEDDVQSTLEMLRENRAQRKPTHRGAQIGYVVQGDVQALDRTGVPIIGNKWEDRVFEIGAPPLGDIVRDQLLGVQVGEQRRFTVAQPQKNVDGKVTNREDHYAITVKSVHEKILPELNDAFAKEVGNFQTLSELREDIRKRIEAQREEEAERMLRNRLADEILKRNDFEVPPSMVDRVLDSLWEDSKEQSDQEISEDEFRKENRPKVVWNIKWDIVWSTIAEQESLTVSEKEMDEEIEKTVSASPKNEKKLRTWFKDPQHRRRLQENLLEEKVMAFLKANAKIKEVSIKRPKERDTHIITQ